MTDDARPNVRSPKRAEAWARRAWLAARRGGGGAATQYAFVYRPHVAPDAPNVFETWGALWPAYNAVQGPKTLEVDTQSGAANVPAGLWGSLHEATIVGRVGNESLTFDDGAVFTLPPRNVFGVELVSNSTAPVFTALYGHTILSEGAKLLTTAAPIYRVNANPAKFILAVSFAATLGDGVLNAVTIDAGANFALLVLDTGQVMPHAVGGAGTLNAAQTVNASYGQPQDAPGPPVQIVDTVYAPTGAVGVVWLASAPSTMSTALDRIAAALSTPGGYLGGPIP